MRSLIPYLVLLPLIGPPEAPLSITVCRPISASSAADNAGEPSTANREVAIQGTADES